MPAGILTSPLSATAMEDVWPQATPMQRLPPEENVQTCRLKKRGWSSRFYIFHMWLHSEVYLIRATKTIPSPRIRSHNLQTRNLSICPPSEVSQTIGSLVLSTLLHMMKLHRYKFGKATSNVLFFFLYTCIKKGSHTQVLCRLKQHQYITLCRQGLGNCSLLLLL